ncbi:hypothetical protein PGH26_13665 [Sporosarcina jeotgali]|uniref:Uncharacterized protein n=1 Tax=Sporosarcina jeotgali TaxID=3020056 RepID=A0ABZ0KVH5_9BACL|nr:hypothetical protein [Sporosarcina sp. B2O-1]WOV83912.1 hypothetical protein PGH26_13665 [Sporosarcina sp. B2O-1]
MYEIKYSNEELNIIYRSIAHKQRKMSNLSNHFGAKVMKIEYQMQSLTETVRTMVLQYHEFERMISEFEQLLRFMDADQYADFDFVEIDRMKEEQIVRLKQIQIILDVPIPDMANEKWIKQREVG